MSRPRRRGRLLAKSTAFVVLVTVSCGFAVTAQAYTPTTVVSSVSKFTYSAGSGIDVTMNAVSCGVPGYCGAIGTSGTVAKSRAIVASELKGRWSDTSPVRFPAGSGSTSPRSWMGPVSCRAHADCTAVGQYQASGGPAAFTVSSRDGVWGDAEPVVFPVGMIGPTDQSWIQTISCASPGNCTAAGYYYDANGKQQPFTLQSTADKWALPVEASFGSVAVRVNLPDISFFDIDCTAPGTCTAVGSFTNADDDNDAMVLSSSNSVWTDIEVAQFSTGAQDATPSSVFTSVSCPKAGDCVAVGYFDDASGDTHAMTDVSSGGTWADVAPAMIATGVQDVTPDSYLNSVSCASVGDCVAVGEYVAASGDSLAFSVESVGGAWNTAITPNFVKGVTPPTYDSYSSVSCPTSQYCVAVGEFHVADTYYGMLDVDKNGIWAAARLEPVGPDDDSGLFNAQFSDVSCAAYGNCSTVGGYEDFPDSEVLVGTALSLSTILPPSAPLAVRVVKVRANSFKVVWNAPSNDGYSPITSYRVVVSPGSSSCETTRSLSCIVEGLRPSTTYRVKVFARNVATFGPPSQVVKDRTPN
ncbi:MAG: fibronectin type III domain-containing protein [Acidimicrobiales bacterium]